MQQTTHFTHAAGSRIETCDCKSPSGQRIKGGNRGTVRAIDADSVTVRWDDIGEQLYTRGTYDANIRNAVWGPI